MLFNKVGLWQHKKIGGLPLVISCSSPCLHFATWKDAVSYFCINLVLLVMGYEHEISVKLR